MILGLYKKFLLTIQTIIIFSLCGQVISSSLEDTETIYRQHCLIKPEDSFCLEDSSYRNGCSIKEFIRKLLEDIKLRDSPDLNIVLNFCGINNENLKDLRESVFEKYRPKIIVIDLSFNHFDQRSASELFNILKYENLKYLNISNTSLSLKSVKILLDYLEDIRINSDSSINPKELSKKLIFMEKNYVKKAKNKVKVYSNLVNQGLLHEDWDQFHLDFYNNFQPKIQYAIKSNMVERLSNSFHRLKL